MKKIKALLLLSLFAVCVLTQAQTVTGKWRTIDDSTGKPKSIVEVSEKNGIVSAKILEILDPNKKNAKCVSCPGSDKNAPLVGLVIIKGLTKDGNEYSGGKILDPASGKLYKCKMKLNGGNLNKLDVRGYLGISIAGRTQTWVRVQ